MYARQSTIPTVMSRLICRIRGKDRLRRKALFPAGSAVFDGAHPFGLRLLSLDATPPNFIASRFLCCADNMGAIAALDLPALFCHYLSGCYAGLEGLRVKRAQPESFSTGSGPLPNGETFFGKPTLEIA